MSLCCKAFIGIISAKPACNLPSLIYYQVILGLLRGVVLCTLYFITHCFISHVFPPGSPCFSLGGFKNTTSSPQWVGFFFQVIYLWLNATCT